jgi:predicted DCC family thiol-disulfide oxidoreductase YuxK
MEQPGRPILLYNDECSVCRRIAGWVKRSARDETGEASIIERPIGDDPEALRLLNPDLDIWNAYATIHLLMPNGSRKQGGEAVAEVLRSLKKTRWFAWIFSVSAFGVRPFQGLLNLAYATLSFVRPLFGCESCGTSSPWMKPVHWLERSAKALVGRGAPQTPGPHFSPLRAKRV